MEQRKNWVLRRTIVSAQNERSCDSPRCEGTIYVGQDYTLYEYGIPGSKVWGRLRRHLSCTPTYKRLVIEQLQDIVEARRQAGDFD